jgi:carboxyl-terminal processing protease
MRKWLIGPIVGAGLIGATLGISAYAVTTGQTDKRAETFAHLELFAEILARVQSDYVTEIDENKAIEASIDGMLSSLDPHSSYMNADEFRDMQVQTSGEYGGLGIEVTGQDGFVKVVSPMDGTPASKAGIKSGDYLTAIDGQSIVGLPLNDAVKQMRGPVGSAISITVVRDGVDPFDVSLKREITRPESVKDHVEGDIGYIRISTFNERTSEGLDAALADIKKQSKGPLKGLVLDLRDNPGGLLDQAIEVSSRFLNGGEVVSTRGRRPEDVQSYRTRGAQRFPNLPIVVLTNGGSASAAEIVAGALQDRGRAKIVGTTTFGKGSVQTVIPLGPNKGAMRLTTSRYYTPSGKSIQGAGIDPDFEVADKRLSDEEIKDIQKRVARYTEASLPNALQNEQGATRKPPHVPADMPPVGYPAPAQGQLGVAGKDYQLDEALKIIREGKAGQSKDMAQTTAPNKT